MSTICLHIYIYMYVRGTYKVTGLYELWAAAYLSVTGCQHNVVPV